MVRLCIVLLFDHSQTTRFHTKKWCDQKKKQWKVTPPCQTIHVLVPAPIQNMQIGTNFIKAYSARCKAYSARCTPSSTQFVPKSPCGIRIQNVFVPWYNTNLCTGPGWIFSNHRPGRRSEAGKHLWHRSAASRPVAAERRLPLVANEPPASGKELPAAAWTELFPGLRSPCNKLQAILLVARAPVVVQETAARTAAAAGRMAVLSDASRPKGTGRRSSRYAFRWTLCAMVHRA
jgi:hypothetical protein